MINLKFVEKIIVLMQIILHFGMYIFNRPIKIISVPYNFIDSHLDVSNSMWFIVKHMKSQWQQYQRIKWLHLPRDISIKRNIADFMH